MSGNEHKPLPFCLSRMTRGTWNILRTVEHELPRHEDEQVHVVINATAEGALDACNDNPLT